MLDCCVSAILTWKFTMLFRPRSILLILLSMVLASCSSVKPVDDNSNPTLYNKKINHDKKSRISDYISKHKRQTSLVLPPDLISSANETVVANHNNAKVKNEVLPEIIGAEVVSQGDKRWLEVQQSPAIVWERIMGYWASEQVPLAKFIPSAGIMETEWIEANVIAGDGSSQVRNLAKQLFSRVVGQGVTHDKYGVRLERGGENLTRVFVSHRATVKKEKEGLSPKKIGNFDWVEVADDPEKVAEILQLFVLLFDFSQIEAAS